MQLLLLGFFAITGAIAGPLQQPLADTRALNGRFLHITGTNPLV